MQGVEQGDGRIRMKGAIKELMPKPLLRVVLKRRELRRLRGVPDQTCETSKLGRCADLDLDAIWRGSTDAADWNAVQTEIAELGITDRAGGVNPGDRRAVHYLVRGLGARSVLEVGTHVGASTVHIAAALRRLAEAGGAPVRLMTCDIADVNDAATEPWRRFGSTHAPAKMIEMLGCDAFVTFVTAPSLAFFGRCEDRFDLIFLDGDHAAPAVYQELAAAMGLLNPGGYILLHDYYPELRPLWSNGHVVPGPYLGARRLIREGANLSIKPLGRLPWPTKLDSDVTSLALACLPR